MKPISKIIIVIVILLIIGFVIYFFVTKSNPIDPNNPSGNSLFPNSGENISTTDNGNPNDSSLENQTVDTSGQFGQDGIEGRVYEDADNELTRVTDKNVISAYIYGEGDLKTTTIRYIEAGTGHVYEFDAEEKTNVRISNKTIPKVKEAIWGNEDNLVVRYLEGEKNTLKTFASTLETITKFDQSMGTTTEMSLEGKFLPDNIRQIAVSPSGQKIYYLLGYSGFVQGFTEEKPKQMFSSKLKSWLLSWPSEDKVLLTTPPSDGVSGYAYFISATRTQTDDDLTKLVGPVNGLRVLQSANSIYSVFSGTLSGKIFTYSLRNGTQTKLGVATLVDKCSFDQITQKLVYCAVSGDLPNAKYPDDWYKGGVNFSDSIYSINLETGLTNLEFDISVKLGFDMDIISLQTNEDDSSLIFIDKNTQNLWLLDLKKEETI